jgi:hypothetical protein
MKTLMRGTGCDCSYGGAYGEPFGGSGYAAQEAASFGCTDGFIAFLG